MVCGKSIMNFDLLYVRFYCLLIIDFRWLIISFGLVFGSSVRLVQLHFSCYFADIYAMLDSALRNRYMETLKMRF